MPYTIERDGAQYCVHKRDTGEQVGCHETRMDAQRQIAALYANEKKRKEGHVYFIGKENGRRYMVLVSSNAFKDRQLEIVTQKALNKYVQDFRPGAPLLVWHGGDPVGEIIHAEMVDAFLVEVAQELPDAPVNLSRLADDPPINSTVKEVWDAIEKSIEKNTVDWGVSVGFGYIRGDKEDGAFNAIEKFESSLLPVVKAANILTTLYIVKEAKNG